MEINARRRIILPLQKYILVVDDDPSMLTSVGRLLKQHGFDTGLFNSAEALFDQPDFDEALCAIIDINLGNGSGIDLRQRLTHEGVAMPVIYITGNDSEKARSAAIESGCIAYLTKPFTAESLMKTIEMAAA